MKKLCILEINGEYHGIFIDACIQQNAHELPVLKLLSYFFKDTLLKNVIVVKSRVRQQAEKGRGQVIGELDGLVLSRSDRTIYLIELKTRHLNEMKRKFERMIKLATVIIEWKSRQKLEPIFSRIVPIIILRRDPEPEVYMQFEDSPITLLTFNMLKDAASEINGNINLSYSNLRRMQENREKLKTQISEGHGIHPLLMNQLKTHPCIPLQDILEKSPGMLVESSFPNLKIKNESRNGNENNSKLKAKGYV